jgi:hypothetical protein
LGGSAQIEVGRSKIQKHTNSIGEEKDMEGTLVDLDRLQVNTENPRFGMTSNQIEAFQMMLADQKEKIHNLAKDIVANGLNPADLVIVMPSINDPDYFLVLEGNRRVVALKLLSNPDLVPEKFKQSQTFFQEYAMKIDMTNFKVPCVIFDNEEAANRWIKLKHTGENEGVGTVGWDSQQKARFDERSGGKATLAIQALNFLREQPFISDDLKAELPVVKITNLQRVLSDPDVREAFGLTVENGVLTSELEPDEVAKPLQRVVRDLLKPTFTVKQIYSKNDRSFYVESLGPKHLPNIKKVAASKWDLKTAQVPAPSLQPKQKRSLKTSSSRNTLIPKSCVIHITHTRINKIYRELKNLGLRDFANSVAITFRVFVELSVDEFLTAKALQGVSVDSKLVAKVQKVAEFMSTGNHLSKDQLKGINVAVSNEHDVLSISTFNSYVHGSKFHPQPDNLKVAWDNVQDFISKVWELM